MKKMVFALLLLIALSVMALDLHWGMRVQRAVSGLLRVGPDAISFRATATDARWVMVESEDTAGLLRAYNANRQLVAERVTPRLPISEPGTLAIAPIAILRTGGMDHEWHLVPRDDHLLRKYLDLSTTPVATSAP